MSNDQNISIDQSAIDRIGWLREQDGHGDKTLLRIAVVGGGCSGFKYDMDLTEDIQKDDIVFGNAVVIDKTSRDIMKNSQIAFQEDLNGAGFVIDNPNVTAGCGCGSSFFVNEA